MSKRNDFEYDVFISYTHLDNQPLIEGQKGWISCFYSLLKVRLGELLGREPNIWFDKKLRAGDELTGEIKSKLQKAKTLLPIVTPRYLKSEWCKKELHGFLKSAENNIGACIGNKSRIFKVIKTYVPHEQ